MIIVPINQSVQYGKNIVDNSHIVNDDTFARLVSEDVKNKISLKQKQILQDPQNWERWKDCLLFLSENLTEQILDIDSDAEQDIQSYVKIGELALMEEAKLAYKNKKNRIERFHFHVQRKLSDVVLMIEKNSTNQITSSETDISGFYKKAILMHRKLIYEYDFEETPIDRALWDAIDGIWSFSDIKVDVD